MSSQQPQTPAGSPWASPGAPTPAAPPKPKHRVWNIYTHFRVASFDQRKGVYYVEAYYLPNNFVNWEVPRNFNTVCIGMTLGEMMEKYYDIYIDPILRHVPDPLDKAADAMKKCFAHKWKRYDGFTNRFDYCEVCDEKKEIPT